MTTNSVCDCCVVSGDSKSFLLETMSVKLTYDIAEDYETRYPFRNSGCGCEYEFAKEEDCVYRHRYRYKSVSTTGTSANVWDGGDGTFNVGGTFSSTVSTETTIENEPPYFTCPCEAQYIEDGGSFLVCQRACTGNIYLGERHISERTVTVSSSVNITDVPCPNENGCVVSSFDPCENLYNENEPDNCYDRPERCGIVTQGQCVAQYAYEENDYDDDLWQTVTQTFGEEADMWDLPWNTGFEKLESIDYSGVWDDTRDCNNFQDSFYRITDFNLYSDAYKWAFAGVGEGPIAGENYICGIAPEVGSQFEKHKLRWRFRTPSSCYIKIWICRYEVKIISPDAPYGYDESFATYELSLEDSSIESHVINIEAIGENSTRCFDGFKACGNHDGWNFTSPEFELTTPEFEFPETDPTLPDQTIGLRKFKGISLAGMSFVEGWEPPLFQYDTEVWKSKCPYLGVISPYWYPTQLININLDPDPDPTKFEINLPQGLVWPTPPEVLANIQTYFDTVINTIPAP
jgi:hypothetical protein